MEHENYFPPKIADRRAWALKYKGAIALEGATLGMLPADIIAEQKQCDTIIASIDVADAEAVVAKQKNQDRDTTIVTEMGTLRPKIKTHKAYTGYTPAIGEALSVIGTGIVVDPLTVKTIVKLAKIPLGVDIKFDLEHCEGGDVYCKRGAEAGFTFLKSITHPHSIDTRPNAGGAASEQRQYYVILLINDIEVGIPSDIVTINN